MIAEDPSEGSTAPDPARYLWVPDGLASVALRLITPAVLSDALSVAGILWHPVEPKEDTFRDRHGLYTWVDGRGGVDPRHSGILYIGIGRSKEGVLNRLDKESSWRGNDHAHGLAIARRDARALVGAVRRQPERPRFVDALISAAVLNERAADYFEQWWSREPLSAAEQLAVRLSIHLGDTVTPVNSQYAGAWNRDDYDADWVAFAVARWMEREAVGPCR